MNANVKDLAQIVISMERKCQERGTIFSVYKQCLKNVEGSVTIWGFSGVGEILSALMELLIPSDPPGNTIFKS